ncbi:MAG: hypothetical protein ACRD40_12190 [Candidatus Acidiferrales bacterium]
MKNAVDKSTLLKLTQRIAKHAPPIQFDLVFENHFSLFLIRPLSKLGQRWLDENVGGEETQYPGNAIACEPRYVQPIWEGAIAAALRVSR